MSPFLVAILNISRLSSTKFVKVFIQSYQPLEAQAQVCEYTF